MRTRDQSTQHTAAHVEETLGSNLAPSRVDMSLEDDTAQTGNGEGAQKRTEAGGEDAVALMRKLLTALERTEKTGNSSKGKHTKRPLHPVGCEFLLDRDA